MDTQRTVQDGMLKSVQVRNFRVFDELSIHQLSRVNLVAGRNNAGKTSLLEALFLLAGGGNPQMAVNANVTRGSELSVSGSTNSLQETYWKPMFFSLDTDKTITICGEHAERGALTLHISLERPNVVEVPFSGTEDVSGKSLQGNRALLLAFADITEHGVESRARVAGQNIEFRQSTAPVPLGAVFLSTRINNEQDDASRLGHLRKQKKGAHVLNALRIIEPKLQSIEDNSAGGLPMIWGDIGLSELVPLAMMGEGMTRLARLVLAIASSPGGLVLVDEIETGLHHTVMADVWRAVDGAAKQFNTQVVATTHSYECVQSAHAALGSGDGFLLHRLEVSEAGNRCVTYQPESIDAAIRHDLEVR